MLVRVFLGNPHKETTIITLQILVKTSKMSKVEFDCVSWKHEVLPGVPGLEEVFGIFQIYCAAGSRSAQDRLNPRVIREMLL